MTFKTVSRFVSVIKIKNMQVRSDKKMCICSPGQRMYNLFKVKVKMFLDIELKKEERHIVVPYSVVTESANLRCPVLKVMHNIQH